MKGSILVISTTMVLGAPNAHGRRLSNQFAGFLLPTSLTHGLSRVGRIMFGTRQHQKIKSIQQVPLQLRRRLSPFCGFPCLELKRGGTEDEIYINTPLDNTSIMDSMEKEVRASAQATLDLKRVKDALTITTTDSSAPLNSREENNDNDGSYYESFLSSSSSSTSMTVLNSPNPTLPMENSPRRRPRSRPSFVHTPPPTPPLLRMLPHNIHCRSP